MNLVPRENLSERERRHWSFPGCTCRWNATHTTRTHIDLDCPELNRQQRGLI